MGGERSLALLSVFAALVIGASHVTGQILETVNVQIINQNFEPARIRVVDDICNVVVFEGQLLPDSSTPVSLCPDRQQQAHMTIYDAEGRAHRYNNLLQSEVYLPMR